MQGANKNLRVLERIKHVIRNPRKITNYLSYMVQKKKEKSWRERLDKNHPFEALNDKFLHRNYKDISEYFLHQKDRPKPNEEDLGTPFKNRLAYFLNEFKQEFEDAKTKSVICLGARDGSEVEAFRQYGLLAVGIDINYEDNNPYVHYGDFHNIPYPDNCFDYVYMNTLNHALEPKAVIEEACRILKPQSGKLFIHLRDGRKEDAGGGGHHSFHWNYKSEIIEFIEAVGLKLERQTKAVGKPFWQCIFVY